MVRVTGVGVARQGRSGVRVVGVRDGQRCARQLALHAHRVIHIRDGKVERDERIK